MCVSRRLGTEIKLLRLKAGGRTVGAAVGAVEARRKLVGAAPVGARSIVETAQILRRVPRKANWKEREKRKN